MLAHWWLGESRRQELADPAALRFEDVRVVLQQLLDGDFEAAFGRRCDLAPGQRQALLKRGRPRHQDLASHPRTYKIIPERDQPAVAADRVEMHDHEL